jgi:F-type H+-transporting ATPase subunit delta
MKKLSAATYAQLLHDSTKGLSVTKQRTVVGKWLVLLRRQRALRLLPRIMSHLQQLDDAARKQTRVRITAADEKGLSTIERQLTDILGRVAIDLTVDSALRGGLVLRVGDDEIDGSLRTRLRRLHHHLINA